MEWYTDWKKALFGSIWIYLVYQWGLVMISQQLWNALVGGMNLHLPAILGFTRVPDFDPYPNCLLKNQFIHIHKSPFWILFLSLSQHIKPAVFKGQFDSGWSRSCPFLAGAVCSTIKQQSLSLYLCPWRIWTLEISMGIVGSWHVISCNHLRVSESYCSNPHGFVP